MVEKRSTVDIKDCFITPSVIEKVTNKSKNKMKGERTNETKVCQAKTEN